MSKKYRDYAKLKTSMRSRVTGNKLFKDGKSAITDMGNELIDAGKTFISDVKDGLGFTSGAESKAVEYMNKANYIRYNEPVDARSTSKVFMNIMKNQVTNIALIENLSMINALPPIPDNIVDPPVIWEQNLVKKDLDSWSSGLIGKDYLERVIARGQFLTLVPLDITPRVTGALRDDVLQNTLGRGGSTGLGAAILGSINGRLNNASYGLTAKVNSTKYYRAVNAHMKAALLSLGIDINTDDMNSMQIATLKKYLPDEIVTRLIGNDKPTIQSIQQRLLGSADVKADDPSRRVGVDSDASFFDMLKKRGTASKNEAMDKFNSLRSGGDKDPFGTEQTTDDAGHITRKNNYINMLKYLLNIDEGEEEVKTMPFSCFYCNGPIEKGLATSSTLGESEIAKMTTNVVSNLLKTEGAAAKITEDLGGGGADYIKELAYHRNLGSFLVSNTYIPNVIKNSMIDFQYTVSIRDIAVSSDRFSIARLFWTLSQLWPFVIQTNEPGKALVVPSAPMYCSAFSKGVMNLPRAAITSMNIKTSPEFQTTEGIPTELDISITIQPLFTQSTMPNFDKFYDGTNNPEYVAAALFNPLSSFNIIATMCGQNTILTKFQAGLMAFFLGGTVTTFLNSVKNTGSLISGSWADWWSSSAIMRNEVYSRTRLIQ